MPCRARSLRAAGRYLRKRGDGQDLKVCTWMPNFSSGQGGGERTQQLWDGSVTHPPWGALLPVGGRGRLCLDFQKPRRHLAGSFFRSAAFQLRLSQLGNRGCFYLASCTFWSAQIGRWSPFFHPPAPAWLIMLKCLSCFLSLLPFFMPSTPGVSGGPWVQNGWHFQSFAVEEQGGGEVPPALSVFGVGSELKIDSKSPQTFSPTLLFFVTPHGGAFAHRENLTPVDV